MKRRTNHRQTGSHKTEAVTSSTIGVRLFKYFAIFAVTIMLILWLLQILFMQTFYQGMKKHELEKIASTIEEGYGTDSVFETVMQLTGRSDIYVQIMSGDTVIFETSPGNPGDRMSRFASTYDCQLLKERLVSGKMNHTVVKLTSQQNGTSSEAMIYASILDDSDGFTSSASETSETSETSDVSGASGDSSSAAPQADETSGATDELPDSQLSGMGTIMDRLGISGESDDSADSSTSSVNDRTYLFIYSPLTAVGTTIDILAEMLIMVTVISLLFGLFMSIFISRRLARPLHKITDSAAQLAEGDYSTQFDGSGYAETEELAAALNYASDELSKSDKLQKDLVANVSHDLKTPLTMVKSYAEMIRDLSGDNPEKRNRHLQVIINESDRLNELVNDLTMLSKMQANVDALDLTQVDLAYIARESLESFSLHSEQDGFSFDINAEGSALVMADEKKIRQVFSNLIGNAIRYSSDDKFVGIEITDRGDWVRCQISDHGQGIAPEDLDSIWDRYYQSSSNHSRTSKGSGLGLSIVKQIFILHKARYGVESVENQGSTFWFELKKDIREQ